MAVSRAEAVPESAVDALRVISGRWKGSVLWRLAERPMRSGELRRSIPGITEKVLRTHLRELVADGIVERHDAGTWPLEVTYSLTDYGHTLGPAVEALCTWGAADLRRRHERHVGAST